MEKRSDWRDLLGNIISDPHQRQQLAEKLKVTTTTLMRWVTGESKPRPDKVNSLLDSLPAQKRLQAFLSLSQEYPAHVFEETTPAIPVVPATISTEFYHRVLNIYTTLPPGLREWSLNTLVIQQILTSLDPRLLGMSAFLAYCTPPAPGKKVRSLRKILEYGTAPWHNTDVYSTQFFGAESLIGQACAKAHSLIVQRREELVWLLDVDLFPSHAESIGVFPLLCSNQVAGNLCVMSTQPHFFSQERIDLLQEYVKLLVLACEQDAFYDFEAIAIGVIPSFEDQDPVLRSFQERVIQCLLRATREQRFLMKPQAERLVWQEIEEELLHSMYERDIRQKMFRSELSVLPRSVK